MSEVKNSVQAKYEVYLDFVCPYDLTKHTYYIKYGTLYVWNKETPVSELQDPDGEYEVFIPIRNGIESADYKYPVEEIATTADDLGYDSEEVAEHLSDVHKLY
tara:strand:+ start:631 stop:939 length:309 start_codon:yes stop_codon:yes gene_type:complete